MSDCCDDDVWDDTDLPAALRLLARASALVFVFSALGLVVLLLYRLGVFVHRLGGWGLS